MRWKRRDGQCLDWSMCDRTFGLRFVGKCLEFTWNFRVKVASVEKHQNTILASGVFWGFKPILGARVSFLFLRLYIGDVCGFYAVAKDCCRFKTTL